MTNGDKSLEDLTNEVWKMVVDLCYADDGSPNKIEDSEDENFCWNTFDLWFGYLKNMIDGRCSLAQSIAFDLEEEVTTMHSTMTAIYKKYR